MKKFLSILLLVTASFAQNLIGSSGAVSSQGATTSSGSFTYGPAADTPIDDSAYTPVANSCNQTLAAGGSYRLTGNLVCSLTGVTPAISLGGLNTKFSLHGFTVTGRVVSIVNPNGNEVFNGGITCDYPDGASFGCFLYDNSATGTFTNPMKAHGLTVWNQAANLGSGTKRSAFFNLTGTTANNPDVEVYNNYFYSDAVGNKDSNRIIVFEANGAPNIWIHNNKAFCGGEEGACQGLIAYGTTGSAREWNNVVSNTNLLCPAGVCGDDPRMLGCDATNNCEIDHNICDGVFGRCDRFRGVANGLFHDNLVINSGEGRSGTGLVHLGDNDDSPNSNTASKVGTVVTMNNPVFIPYKNNWRVQVTGCSDTNANIANAVITKTGANTFTYNVGVSGSTTPTGCVVNVSESSCNNEVYNNTFVVGVDGTKLIWMRGIDCVNVHDNAIKTTLVNALTTGDNYLGYMRINGPVTNALFTRNYGATAIQSSGGGGACGASHGQVCLEADATITTTTCKTGTAFGGGTITTVTGC